MTVNELAIALDGFIPASLSEEWDNDGKMVIPDGNKKVEKAVIALDATDKAIDFALSSGAQVIITHHPLIFRSLERLDGSDSVGKRIVKCVKNGLAVLSYHTRLDSVEGGVNDQLAAAVGLTGVSAFLPFARIGTLAESVDFEKFAADCEKALGEKPVCAVKSRANVKNVALVSGGGKGHVRDAFSAGADTYLTGEADHASLIDAAEYGINMLCMTHHATERVVLPFLAKTVGTASGGAIETMIFDFDRVREYGV